MKLKKIFFDAYRSLENAEIDFSQNSCLGLVGINESGKTNVLSAIRILDEELDLTKKDSPRLSGTLPSIRFLFEVGDEDKKIVDDEFKKWLSEKSLLDKEFQLENINLMYHASINKDDEEVRDVCIENIKIGFLLKMSGLAESVNF